MISDPVLTFRNHNQFSEEQAGLTKVRDLHRQLWVRRHSPWSWLVWPVRYYVDMLLASIPNFVIAIIGWLVVFGILYALSAHQATAADAGPGVLHGMEDAIAAFFGMQPPPDFEEVEQTGELMVWLTLFVILVGFVHLGIFVSHLYSIMSRR